MSRVVRGIMDRVRIREAGAKYQKRAKRKRKHRWCKYIRQCVGING